jgi:hypothetical protein
MPLDLAVIGCDAGTVTQKRRIKARDPPSRARSEAWSNALCNGFAKNVI